MQRTILPELFEEQHDLPSVDTQHSRLDHARPSDDAIAADDRQLPHPVAQEGLAGERRPALFVQHAVGKVQPTGEQAALREAGAGGIDLPGGSRCRSGRLPGYPVISVNDLEGAIGGYLADNDVLRLSGLVTPAVLLNHDWLLVAAFV